MTKSEREERFRKLSNMGCIVCRLHHGVYTSPHIHHLTGIKYRSTGKKADDLATLPLCPAHHQHGGYGIAIHAGVKAFEEAWGSQEELLAVTNEIIEQYDLTMH